MKATTHLFEALRQLLAAEKLKRLLFFVVTPALLFYGLVLIGLQSAGYETMEILRDPAQQLDVSSFLGFVSNIGVWLWVSSTAICFFSILTAGKELRAKRQELLLLAGGLSFLLAIDDFFLIHDRYIDQKLCYFAYGVFALAILVRHYQTILRIDGLAFVLAGLFLAGSIFTDLVQGYLPLRYSDVQIIEEGFKFLGGATWLYFVGQVASFRVHS